MTKGNNIYRVNLRSQDAESVLTNSAKLAKVIERSECRNSEDVMRELEKEVRGKNCEEDKKGF